MSASALPLLETAAQHLVERVPTARAQETVEAAIARLPGHAFDSLEAIYIVDKDKHLQGLVRLTNLLNFPQEQTLGEVMTANPPTVYLDDDQEDVASLAVQHGLASIPVIDRQGCLLGVVPSQTLLAILRREHIEDLHRLAGIQRSLDSLKYCVV